MAAEMFGGKSATVLTSDDVAVESSLHSQGRRGVAATVLVEKIVGAAAEEGQDLAAVTALCQRVQDNVRSMGMALTSCTVPAAGKPTFEIGDDEMELGVGIHGEPGRERRKLATADEITEALMTPILDDGGFGSGDRVLAFVNGMGGTPLLELYVVYNKVAAMCRDRGMTIERNLVGSYITSLEMAGCSITLLKLDDELLRLWDAPVHTAALRWGV
jgi:dihydroxyacetone kinase-like protein